MRCVEAQKLIKPYFYHELTDTEMAQLLAHIEHCPDCHEELEISMAVYTAIDGDLDDAEDYNFTRRLDRQLRTDGEALERRSIASGINKLIIMVAEVALVLIMISAISYKINQQMAAQHFSEEHSLLTESESETDTEIAEETEAGNVPAERTEHE